MRWFINWKKKYQDLVDRQIGEIQKITSNLDETYMNKNAVLGRNNISTEILAGIMQGAFYETIVVSSDRTYDITDICSEKDFTILFNTNDSNGNKVLKRGADESSDYNITLEDDLVILTLLSDSIREGHLLYLTGIKFGI